MAKLHCVAIAVNGDIKYLDSDYISKHLTDNITEILIQMRTIFWPWDEIPKKEQQKIIQSYEISPYTEKRISGCYWLVTF